ncbi:MAG TPA: hypothetical protein VKK31_30840 [Thermoanaerobaculia bacterium]|nr:hypothetical protein [Thermoanaerobaculia bacterium]
MSDRGPFDDLARLLATPEGLRTARLLQGAGLLRPPDRGPEPPPPPPPGRRIPEPISIWQPAEIDGEPAFVRPDPLPLGDHYAATRVLRPKKAELPLRVAFFGESVAAGYLYAPHLTPARVLEARLQAAGGADNFEVIDLARTNETLCSLAETVRTSLQINPDVLVLFVGNNWNLLETPEASPWAPAVEARQRYARALREDGIAGPVRLAAEELRARAEATLDFIALIAGAVHIPVVVVVPEVNLADWENRQPPLWLPGDGNARWHALYAEAVERLERRDFEAALTAARAMQELDGGACPTAWRILARAWTELGDLERAAGAARSEVDAATYPTLAFLGAPQATTAAREILLGAARRHGFSHVDLREVFNSPLPGRRLFLDYCHLTLEGIETAMAAVAAEVLNLSGMPVLGSMEPKTEIAPEAEATARLGAAIHTAHRLLTAGPKRPILEHWCEAALDASPGIEETLFDLIEARCAPSPAVLTAAQQRNLASPYRLLLQHGWRWDHLDADLILAVEAVLERRGRPARDRIARLLLRHHALPAGGTDLTEPPYLWEPLERFYPEVMRFEDLAERATFRSPWPESSFCLVCDARRDVEIEPTLRLPAPAGHRGSVTVAVNGEQAGRMDATERWSRTALLLPRSCLRPGLNRLTLRWPAPETDGAAALHAAAERLELGLAASLHPVFGEVFSLVARRR